MKTIHKYPLLITDEQWIQLPRGAEIIHAGLDPQGDICLWAVVDPSEPRQSDHDIRIVGTGGDMPQDPCRHLGSVRSGPFMWHVFTRVFPL